MANYTLSKFAVGNQPARNMARAHAVERSVEQWNLAGVEAQRHIGRQRHFASVRNHAEAGNVGHRMDGPCLFCDDFSRVLIQRDCARDRKSTRLNSSHLGISYAVFCLKKKK